MPERAARLLDAAIEVLGTRGMRHLTHRAVDRVGGLPMGSTSNRFRTRDALLIGALRRILERETELWSRLAAELPDDSIETVAASIGRLLEELTGAQRVLSQARRTIFVEAINEPVLHAEITHARAAIGDWLTPQLDRIGIADPPRDVQHLLALMDGLTIHQLADPRPDFDPAAGIAALLRGLSTDPR